MKKVFQYILLIISMFLVGLLSAYVAILLIQPKGKIVFETRPTDITNFINIYITNTNIAIKDVIIYTTSRIELVKEGTNIVFVHYRITNFANIEEIEKFIRKKELGINYYIGYEFLEPAVALKIEKNINFGTNSLLKFINDFNVGCELILSKTTPKLSVYVKGEF